MATRNPGNSPVQGGSFIPILYDGFYKSQVVVSWISEPLTALSILHKSYISPKKQIIIAAQFGDSLAGGLPFTFWHATSSWCSFFSWVRRDQARGSCCSVSSRWLASKSNSSPEENLGEAKRETPTASWTKIQGWHWFQAWNRINVSMIVLRTTKIIPAAIPRSRKILYNARISNACFLFHWLLVAFSTIPKLNHSL